MPRFRPKQWLKSMAVNSGILRAATRLARPRVLVLGYHSVVENPQDTANTIRISHARASFEAQIGALARHFNPVTIEQVREFAAEGKPLPPRSAAVTFDDGFADNHDVATPILNRYGVPATFYIMVNAVDTGTPPWYARLNFAFNTTAVREWKHPENNRTFAIASDDGKKAALNVVWDLGAALAGAAQEQFIRQIEESLQVEPLDRKSGLMMNWDQVRALKNAGHTIGGHTLSHPNLAHVTEVDARAEIQGCKQRLDEKLGQPIQHFSYPHPALEPHWNQRTLQITREAGFKSAVLTTTGPVFSGEEPLSLKRIPAGKDFDGWIWRMERWFLQTGASSRLPG
ncbi:MAG TPA: polysaccharide deacetylase family protein [Terriglobales bacterium]|nr:polysaccharide deacetylase family protein [Terriglobales bacterium]